jgi:hypothetical protein
MADEIRTRGIGSRAEALGSHTRQEEGSNNRAVVKRIVDVRVATTRKRLKMTLSDTARRYEAIEAKKKSCWLAVSTALPLDSSLVPVIEIIKYRMDKLVI